MTAADASDSRDGTTIPLHDRRGRIVAHAVIDVADLDQSAHAWYRLASGYVVRTVKEDGQRRMLYLHRELLGLTAGDPTHVDHIDRDRLNNRRGNLRAGPARLNAQNRPPLSPGRTLPRGVHYRASRSGGRYLAIAKIDGVPHHLGSFPSAEQANTVVIAFRREHMPWSVEPDVDLRGIS